MAAQPARARPHAPPLPSKGRGPSTDNANIRKNFRENAGDACIPAGISSRSLSAMLGIPVLVFYFDEMPHAFKSPEDIRAFNKSQGEDRAAWILRQIRRRGGASADAAAKAQGSRKPMADDVWDIDTWKDLAADCADGLTGPFAKPLTGPVSARRQRTGRFRLRLAGKDSVTEALIFLPHRGWTTEAHWRWFVNMEPGQLERWPSSAQPPAAATTAKARLSEQSASAAFMHYIYMHEVGHVVQRDAPEDFHRRWTEERDADRFALAQMRMLARQSGTDPGFAAALEDTARQIVKARALRAFLGSVDPEYDFAPALEESAEAKALAALNARQTPTSKNQAAKNQSAKPHDTVGADDVRLADACRDAATELKLRVWSKLNGRALPWTSAELQAAIPLWRRGALDNAPLRMALVAAERDWGEMGARPGPALMALREIAARGHAKNGGAKSGRAEDGLTDPLVRQMAAGVLAAAHYFCPSLVRKAPPPAPQGAKINTPQGAGINLPQGAKTNRPSSPPARRAANANRPTP